MSKKIDNSPQPSGDERPAHDAETVRIAIAVLRSESAAIAAAADRIDQSIARAVQLLFECQGRVIVTGMGKMGCIARKATATFCSTGTPAIFLHPGEAVHGDLGIVTAQDVLVVLSNSGETREIIGLLPFMTRLGMPIIALTGNSNSALATRANVVVDTGVESEADPIAVTPTNSTAVALAMCDALAVALMERHQFTKEQFAIFHPGGNLGGKLLIRVADVMHVGDEIPKISETESLRKGISVISAKRLGAVFIVSSNNSVLGIVTDGDLRRIVEMALDESRRNLLDDSMSNQMTPSPKTIPSDALAAEALRLMEDNGISILPVVDADETLVGVIHLHDLIRAGLA